MSGIKQLIKSAISSWKSDGFRSTLFKIGKHIASIAKYKYFYSPAMPPIDIYYSNKNINICYRDKYLFRDRKYSVCPKPTDIVVEAGVYHGEDTAMFAKLGKKVYGFEPSPRNFAKAKDNLKKFRNVELYNAGLWESEGEMEINFAENPSDDGFLRPDSEETHRSKSIPVYNIEDFVENNNITGIDFLKVEAEGAEPEIVKGIGDLNIRNIVVNAGLERENKSPAKEVIDILNKKGYDLVGLGEGRILYFSYNTVINEHKLVL